MASYDPGNSRQILAALISDLNADSQVNRCPKCDRFGVVSGVHDYYGIIYKCNCQAVLWVISPETGDAFGGSLCEHRIEEVKA